MPLRPPIVVARPRDWTRVATWLVLAGLLAMALVITLLARLPRAWVDLAQGHPWLVRAVMFLLCLWVLRWLGDFAYARLPRASYVLGKGVVFPEQAGRRRIKLDDVDRIEVEMRAAPVHEAFVAVMRDGTTHVVCATHQIGAPALYATAARAVARRKRREAKRTAKLRRRQSSAK